jgi:hypothetical protein
MPMILPKSKNTFPPKQAKSILEIEFFLREKIQETGNTDFLIHFL